MIVAVTGGKGGVGKSTLAWNLGRELEGVVVDVDLATADLPRGRGPDLHDVLAGRASPMDAVESVSGVALLPSGRTLAGARACDLSKLPDALEYVDRQFGTVLVDCPAGLARDVGIALEAADVSLVVTTDEKPAIVDAMKTRDLAIDVGAPPACIAINRASTGSNGGLIGEVEHQFNAPAAVVPEAPPLARTGSEWVAVRDLAPESAALSAVESVAEHVRACDQRSPGRPEGA